MGLKNSSKRYAITAVSLARMSHRRGQGQAFQTTPNLRIKSVGVISQRTIIERHPFVEDADKEMERIAEEKDDSDDIMGGHNE